MLRLWKDERVIAEIDDNYMNNIVIFEGEAYKLYSSEAERIFNYTWVMCQIYERRGWLWRWWHGTRL